MSLLSHELGQGWIDGADDDVLGAAHVQVADDHTRCYWWLTLTAAMLVGSRRFVPRYRAVSESTADAATDDDDYDKEYDDDDAGIGGVASGSYESFSRCDLMLTDADDSAAPLRSHPRTGMSAACDLNSRLP